MSALEVDGLVGSGFDACGTGGDGPAAAGGVDAEAVVVEEAIDVLDHLPARAGWWTDGSGLFRIVVVT